MSDIPEQPKEKKEFPNHEIFEANRKSWVKGQSGNPAGKAKGTLNRATILKRYLAATFKDDLGQTKKQPFGMDGDPLTVEEVLEIAQIKKAAKGDTAAYKEIKDSVYGKNPDIVIPLGDEPNHKNEELKGEALKAELEKRGLPTVLFEE